MSAPVLLVHGTNDIPVDVDQSRRMAGALNDRLEELVIIEDADHSLSRYAWRKTLYDKLDGFLKKHLFRVGRVHQPSTFLTMATSWSC